MGTSGENRYAASRHPQLIGTRVSWRQLRGQLLLRFQPETDPVSCGVSRRRPFRMRQLAYRFFQIRGQVLTRRSRGIASRFRGDRCRVTFGARFGRDGRDCQVRFQMCSLLCHDQAPLVFIERTIVSHRNITGPETGLSCCHRASPAACLLGLVEPEHSSHCRPSRSCRPVRGPTRRKHGTSIAQI